MHNQEIYDKIYANKAYQKKVADLAVARDIKSQKIIDYRNDKLQTLAAEMERRKSAIFADFEQSMSQNGLDFERSQEAVTNFAFDLVERGKDLPERFW